MENAQLDVPILYIIFNRPEKTRRSFAEIRKARPTKLFITADGPRKDRPQDLELCRLTREVVQNVDWPCEVKTLFREQNVGTKVVGPTAIRWFFDNVDQGIILEDDGFPDPSFFPYVRELLERYKDEPRVMQISGDNFQQNNKNFKCDGDYYFSRMPHVWGWATWRRAWDLFDYEMTRWPKAKTDKLLLNIFKDGAVANYWEYYFDQSIKDRLEPRAQARIDWDGRWVFACLLNNGYSITPRINLVTNIGFDGEARIARNPNDEFANIPTQPMGFPLHHPQKIEVNIQADKYTNKYIKKINLRLSQRVQWFFKSNFPGVYSQIKKLRGSKK